MPERLNADLICDKMLAIIKKFMIFNRLETHTLKTILSMEDAADGQRFATVQRFQKGEIVINEGDFGSCSFWVIKGIFDVVQKGVHLATLHTPGEVFGEMSMFEKIPRVATVTAVTESICLSLDMSMVCQLEDTEVGAVIRREFRDIMVSRLEETLAWLESEKERIGDQYATLLESKQNLAARLRLAY